MKGNALAGGKRSDCEKEMVARQMERPRKKKIPKPEGVRLLFLFCQVGATGWFEIDGFLGLEFFLCSPNVQNYPPFCMC